jgi:hypothetical protein
LRSADADGYLTGLAALASGDRLVAGVDRRLPCVDELGTERVEL